MKTRAQVTMRIRAILLSLVIFSLNISKGIAQNQDSISQYNYELDSLYIEEIENRHLSDKVLHAEPLYIDLIRDLGARKGEKEWNVGMGITDRYEYDSYLALIEYEWAPIDRLGLEVELPATFYFRNDVNSSVPASRINSLKLAGQYSFYVSEFNKTSMAVGYIHEFELTDFNKYLSESILKGNVINPFFVVAKRFGQNYHTLIYTGPEIIKHYSETVYSTNWQINASFHYMITGTRNFIGVEFNQEVWKESYSMVIRPQMRLAINEQLMVGIVAGIPVSKDNERMSSFMRIIYEPAHKARLKHHEEVK